MTEKKPIKTKRPKHSQNKLTHIISQSETSKEWFLSVKEKLENQGIKLQEHPKLYELRTKYGGGSMTISFGTFGINVSGSIINPSHFETLEDFQEWMNCLFD